MNCFERAEADAYEQAKHLEDIPESIDYAICPHCGQITHRHQLETMEVFKAFCENCERSYIVEAYPTYFYRTHKSID